MLRVIDYSGPKAVDCGLFSAADVVELFELGLLSNAVLECASGCTRTCCGDYTDGFRCGFCDDAGLSPQAEDVINNTSTTVLVREDCPHILAAFGHKPADLPTHAEVCAHYAS